MSTEEISTYLQRAGDMLQVARFNLDEGFHTTAVNRVYADGYKK